MKRINACAAYLECLAQRQVRVHDPETGEERSFTAQDSRVVAVSPNAFVYEVN